MRNLLYNYIIKDFTNHGYEYCLEYFPHDSSILDIGIGNGKMLKTFHPVIKSKQLNITGIDINKAYLKNCKRLIKKYDLQDHLSIYHEPIEQFSPPNNKSYDFVLFSMSFMLFNDQPLILDKVKDCLHPNGEIVFSQTMFKEKSWLLDIAKPKLRYLTTVDFGKATYENEFFTLLENHNLSVLHDKATPGKCCKGEYRMIVARPN
ncbi:class I SAM-dependent methyltransferase [Candidatus Electrothrix sp.]|uniref:class I SAM-dependent methyltransferase n=1 Tax=Candidatus Electrothrix sp. TaxID=2170559 RepID=UPI00405655A7